MDETPLSMLLDALTDRLDPAGNGWQDGDYSLLLDISDFLHGIDA